MKELIQKDERFLHILLAPPLMYGSYLNNKKRKPEIIIPYSKEELGLIDDYFDLLSALDDIDDAYDKSVLKITVDLRNTMRKNEKI